MLHLTRTWILRDNDTSPRVVTLYKGDSIGYDITEPTNGTFEFDWLEDSV